MPLLPAVGQFAATGVPSSPDRRVVAVPNGDCGPADGPDHGPRGPLDDPLTVADDDGMVVSYTFTIESTGGNGIVVPGWGFLLNNELTDFDYSSLDGPQSRRRRQAAAQLDVTDDRHRHGQPVLAVGSPGGSMIITTVLQVLLERLELGETLPQAIAAPRASQRNGARASPSRPSWHPRRARATAQKGHAFGTPQAEIGATTGIEFFDRGRCSLPPNPSDGAAAARWWSRTG